MNIKAEETADVDEHVWVARRRRRQGRLAGRRLLPRRPPDQHDHRGLGPAAARRPGVVRRPHQGRRRPAVGRRASSPSPTSTCRAATTCRSSPPTPTSALVHPDFNDGARMLRRGYNFVDGSNSLGGLDAGLFFLAFVRNPDTHFIPIQNKMAVAGRADGVPQGQRLRALRRTARDRRGRVRRPGAVRLDPPRVRSCRPWYRSGSGLRCAWSPIATSACDHRGS